MREKGDKYIFCAKRMRNPGHRRSTVRFHQSALAEKNVLIPFFPAFSLIELMIAIVILGLGMVMVATLFPVAWSRARKLSEFTSQQAITDAANASVNLLGQVAGPGFNSAGFAGDLIFDPAFALGTGAIVAYGDTRVHALHLENLPVGAGLEPVNEAPWEVEQLPRPPPSTGPGTLLWDPEFAPGPDFVSRSYYSPQVLFHERVYPPMRAWATLSSDEEQEQWDDMLATRRFCWAAFHRLSEYVGPDPAAGLSLAAANAQAQAAIRSTRTFDMYYVTLRRPNPTNHYARQNPASAPDPGDLTLSAAAPAALGAANDVMFPVPWRVQVWLPENPPLAMNATGIPTEIEVPVPLGDTPVEAAMLVNLFPSGTWFIDEITGRAYRVAKRRVTVGGDNAFLTLDREMFVEDVNLPSDYLPCGGGDCDPGIEITERRRTVWVFPPPVEAARVGGGADGVPVFKGSQPVVGIDIRSLTVAAYD